MRRLLAVASVAILAAGVGALALAHAAHRVSSRDPPPPVPLLYGVREGTTVVASMAARPPLPDRDGKTAVRRVAVRVVGTDGRPLSGASVCITEGGDTASRAVPVARGRTDEDGIFRSDVEAAHELSAAAWSPNFLPSVVLLPSAEAQGATEQVEITLAPGREVRGALVFLDGTPAAGLRIEAMGAGYGRDILASETQVMAYPGSGFGSGVTDSAGRFVIGGMGDRPALLFPGDPSWAFHRGGSEFGEGEAGRPALGPEAERTFEVRRRGLLCFRATSARTGRPLCASLDGFSIRTAGVSHDTDAGQDGGPPLHRMANLWPNGAYRGDGVYAFPVHVDSPSQNVSVCLTLIGHEPVEFDVPVAWGELPGAPGPQVAVKCSPSGPEGVGQVILSVSGGTDMAGEKALLCGAQRSVPLPGRKQNSVSAFATRSGPARFETDLPEGEYKRIAIVMNDRVRLESAPFSVRTGETTAVELRPVQRPGLTLLLETVDEEGRPLPDCAASIQRAAGSPELQALASIGLGASGGAWPTPLFVPFTRAELDAWDFGELYVIARRPGFGHAFAKLSLSKECGETHRIRIILPSAASN